MKPVTALPKAIFFDWDGTLVDSFGFMCGAHVHVHSRLGIEGFSSDIFKGYFGKPRDEIYEGIYGERQEPARTYFEQYVAEHHVKQIKPMQGAEDLLDYIREAGIISGIVSNKKTEFLKEEITHFGWDKYFSSIIGAGDAGKDKPAADPLILALSSSDIEPHSEHVWYVGDTQIDVDCAANAGCGSVFILSGEGKMESSYPFLVAENCLQLREFLLQCVEK